MQHPFLSDFSTAYIALLSRLLVISFTCCAGLLGSPYDTSFPLLPARPGLAPEALALDGAVLAVLAPLARWDGVYYLHLASPWGSYGDGEHLSAFLPGFPFALRCARAALRPLEAAGLLSPRPALLLGGVALNVACFVVAAVALEALTARVLGRGGRAAALAFCASPGGVFFSAVYTEAPFAAATFLGLLALEGVVAWGGGGGGARRRGSAGGGGGSAGAAVCLATGAAVLAAAAALRSNGALGAVFVAWALLRLACSLRGAARLAALLLAAPPLLAAPLLPLAAFQAWGGARWCGAARGGGARPPWCPPPGAPPPSLLAPPPLYAHVQAAYWGVGLLRRWTLGNAPQLLLAAPMVGAAVVACAVAARGAARVAPWRGAEGCWGALRVLARALGGSGSGGGGGGAREPPQRALHALAVLPYAAHWAALAVGGALVAHPQVVTRMCAAGCPALYWVLADAWEGAGEKGARGGPLVRAAIAAWCVGYTLVGAALFGNFYNWT
jgi:phosphatidylinositol glycan class V